MLRTNVLPRANEIGTQWNESLKNGCGIPHTHTKRVARLIQLEIWSNEGEHQKGTTPLRLCPLGEPLYPSVNF
jgi:hypothetical protein